MVIGVSYIPVKYPSTVYCKGYLSTAGKAIKKNRSRDQKAHSPVTPLKNGETIGFRKKAVLDPGKSVLLFNLLILYFLSLSMMCRGVEIDSRCNFFGIKKTGEF